MINSPAGTKILITVPNLSLPGGVSNIYRSIKWNKDDNVSYFFNTSPNPWLKFGFIPLMYCQFLKNIIGVPLIQLNPSFNPKSIIRDGMLLLLSKLFRKRVIVFFHGWDEEFEITIRDNIVYRKLFLMTYNQADVFLLLGLTFSRKLKYLGISSGRIYYLPTLASDLNIKKTRVKKSGRKTLLFISRFAPLKGMDVVLNTFHYMQDHCKDFNFNLIMAGDGPELAKCKRFVQEHELKYVQFTGYVEGVAKHNCFTKADFLFFPTSYPEGLPCVIMEAMLYGLVIITRPVGGIPDWVKQNENGWLSDSTEGSDFAKGILSIAENPVMMEEIANNNRITARNHFTPKRYKQQLKSIYKDILHEC